MINVHFSSSSHTSSNTNLVLQTPSLARCFFKPNSITEIDREALPFSRRFLLVCGNRESLQPWVNRGITQTNSRQMKTENRDYPVAVRHSSLFVITKVVRLLRWMPLNTGSCWWSVNIILFHSTLAFSLQEMLVEWTLLCAAAKSGPSCSALFSVCLLFHECTWALKQPLASKSRVSLLVYVHLWEGEGEGEGRQKDSNWGQSCFDHAGVSLMWCSSLPEHLSYHHRCGPEWEASSTGSAFLLQHYFLWCLCLWITDRQSPADHVEYTAVGAARSWQASEELQKKWAPGIHTGMLHFNCMIGSCLCSVQTFLFHTHVLKTRMGSPWLKNTAAVASLFPLDIHHCNWSSWRSHQCLQPFRVICFSQLVVF